MRPELDMKTGMKKVRVLVVDDSALMRKLIPQMLETDSSIEVAGTAMDGTFCLKKIDELAPDVVTLDLQMPGMNGIDTLKEIMRRNPLPVIVVSSHSTEGASVTFKALGLGAFDFVTKPQDASAHMADTAKELIAKIKAASECKIVRPGAFKLSPPLEKLSSGKSAPPLPEARKLSNICWPSCLQIFREPLWSCNTCRKVLPKCLPAASTNYVPCV